MIFLSLRLTLKSGSLILKTEKFLRDFPMKFGVIADDYTGANDTGVQFVKRELKNL